MTELLQVLAPVIGGIVGIGIGLVLITIYHWFYYR